MILTACSQENTTKPFDLQGHRGARGLLPENTIPGFLYAIDLGVDTIEFDVVVTKDRHLLISHEPWFNHHISTKPDGTPVTEEEQMSTNIFEMTVEETRKYDVGIRGNSNFPDQEPIQVQKPLMADAIRKMENYVTENNLKPVAYNIETKSYPELYGVLAPQPKEFATLLFEELSVLNEEFNLFDRIIIQSFDPATLIEFKKLNSDIDQAILVQSDEPMENFIKSLGYIPEIWSPNYNLVTSETVQKAHKLGMKVIPWTVNEIDEMRNQLTLGVDGFITDYPNRAADFK